MRRSLRLLILPLIYLLGTLCLHADPSDSSPTNSAATPVTDPALVSHHYREVVARPEFQETEEVDVNARFGQMLSLWFLRLGKKFGEFTYASEMPVFASLLMSVLVVLSVAGLFYIMVRLTRRRHGMDAEPPTGIPGQKMFHPPEFYEEEIRQAILEGDWHAAWLAAWRQFLSRLENRHLVEPDRTRTNREYLAQLGAHNLPSSALTLLTGMVDAYDQFIYGRKFIEESEWNLFHQQMNEAALLLHLNDARTGPRTKPGQA